MADSESRKLKYAISIKSINGIFWGVGVLVIFVKVGC